jgi:hypothetical protein
LVVGLVLGARPGAVVPQRWVQALRTRSVQLAARVASRRSIVVAQQILQSSISSATAVYVRVAFHLFRSFVFLIAFRSSRNSSVASLVAKGESIVKKLDALLSSTWAIRSFTLRVLLSSMCLSVLFFCVFSGFECKFPHRLHGYHVTLPMFPSLSQRTLLHGKGCALSGAIDWANAHNLYSRTNNTQQSWISIGAAFNLEHCMRVCHVAHAPPLCMHHILT